MDYIYTKFEGSRSYCLFLQAVDPSTLSGVIAGGEFLRNSNSSVFIPDIRFV